MKKEETVQIGKVKKFNINLTKPYVVNFEGIETPGLSLFCGLNGSGKSLIMKVQWIMNVVANYCAISQVYPTTTDFDQEINFLFDNTFSDNNFTGNISIEYENLSMKLELKEGKYSSFTFDTSKNLIPNPMPMYLSSETRLLSAHTKYMRMKKALGIPSNAEEFSNEDLNKLMDIYKIYDVMFMESFLEKLNGYDFTEEDNNNFEVFKAQKTSFGKILVGKETCTIKSISNDSPAIDLTLLSSGEQAVFVMIISQKILSN